MDQMDTVANGFANEFCVCFNVWLTPLLGLAG